MFKTLGNIFPIAWYTQGTLDNDVIASSAPATQNATPLLVISLTCGGLLVLLTVLYFIGLPFYKKGKLKGVFFDGIYDWFNKK